MGKTFAIKNPYALPDRPLYKYDTYVDQSAKKIITLQKNLVHRASLSDAAKSDLHVHIDALKIALRHGHDSCEVVRCASGLSEAIRTHVGRTRGASLDVYTAGLAKSGRALQHCFQKVGTCYQFHETVGPQQDAYFASLRDDFIAMNLTSLSRTSRVGREDNIGRAAAHAAATFDPSSVQALPVPSWPESYTGSVGGSSESQSWSTTWAAPPAGPYVGSSWLHSDAQVAPLWHDTCVAPSVDLHPALSWNHVGDALSAQTNATPAWHDRYATPGWGEPCDVPRPKRAKYAPAAPLDGPTYDLARRALKPSVFRQMCPSVAYGHPDELLLG